MKWLMPITQAPPDTMGNSKSSSEIQSLIGGLLRSVRVGTIVDLETRDCRLRILLIDETSRMIDDRRLLQGLPEVDKG